MVHSPIYAKIKNGELSRLTNGNIEQAELLRVFGEASTRKKQHAKTSENTQDTQHENALLREKIHLLESLLDEVRDDREWLRGQLRLLQAPPKEEEISPKKRGLLSRLFG